MDTTPAKQYDYDLDSDDELYRLDEQIFPDGKELDLTFRFGPNIVKILLETVVADSDRIRADITLEVENFEMLGLYHSILDSEKFKYTNKQRRWICRELPDLRELTVSWNGLLIVIISKSKEEYEDQDELLSPETAHRYTNKWPAMKVPKQSINKLTLVLDNPIELKKEYELRYIVPTGKEKLFDRIEVEVDDDTNKRKKYSKKGKKVDKTKEIRKQLSLVNINDNK